MQHINQHINTSTWTPNRNLCSSRKISVNRLFETPKLEIRKFVWNRRPSEAPEYKKVQFPLLELKFSLVCDFKSSSRFWLSFSSCRVQVGTCRCKIFTCRSFRYFCTWIHHSIKINTSINTSTHQHININTSISTHQVWQTVCVCGGGGWTFFSCCC